MQDGVDGRREKEANGAWTMTLGEKLNDRQLALHFTNM
jgi:hypothetical protein